MSSTVVTLSVLGRDYHVRCDSDEVTELFSAGEMVDERMREASNADVTAMDRLAVITALNLAYENRRLSNQLKAVNAGVTKLSVRVGDTLRELEHPATQRQD